MKRTRDEARCPGVVDLHEAEDGWVARVRLPGGRATPAHLDAIARVATTGNGLVDITSRANLQIRGLRATAGPSVAATLAAAVALPSITNDVRRNIVASPLAGRHPAALAETDGIVDDLDQAICNDTRLESLPDRFLFGVDDGSRVLSGVRFDVSLVAERDVGASRFRLVVAGIATSVCAEASRAADVASAAAIAFLAEKDRARSTAWHVRELSGGAADVMARMGAEPADSDVPVPPVVVRPG
ncbi:MAG: precorrin-3B synthase, partial [Chloroflexi bacterium]|nr:precorrin-3B synthase [Chloroflexota bacterium]